MAHFQVKFQIGKDVRLENSYIKASFMSIKIFPHFNPSTNFSNKKKLKKTMFFTFDLENHAWVDPKTN